MSQGYIKLHRKIQENWVWDEKANNASAWTDLLLMAAWSSTQKHINGQIYQIQRGEIVASLRYFANKWRWPKNKVRRFFDKLEKTEMITIKRDTQITHLTICNYDTYNSPEISNGTPMGHERDSDFQKVYKKRDTQKPPQSKEPEQVTRHKKNKMGQQRDSNGTANEPKAGQKIKNKEIKNKEENFKKFEEEGFRARCEMYGASQHIESVRKIVELYNDFVGPNSAVKPKFFGSIKEVCQRLNAGHSLDQVWDSIHEVLLRHKQKDKFMRNISSENLISGEHKYKADEKL